MIRTSRPVSSATSRRAVSSRRLAPVRACPSAGSRSGRRARDGGCRRRATAGPTSWRTTMPPADVAVAVLSRATAPMRRAGVGPSRRRPDRAHCIATERPRATAARSRGRRPAGWRASRLAAGVSGATSGPVQDGRSRAGRAGTSRTAAGRAGARGRGPTGGRIGPPGGPRTWRRCCAPWAAMVPRSGRPCKRRVEHFAHLRRVSGASAPRASAQVDLATRRGDVEVQDARGVGPQRCEVGPQGARRRRGSSGRSARRGSPRARALPSVPSMSGP